MRIDFFEKSLRRFINRLGFDFHRFRPDSTACFQLIKGLNRFKVDLVFDVGANTGQFAQDLRSFGYSERIVSFEPLSDAHSQLTLNASSDINWQVHERGAIGDFNGKIDINVAGNSVSSSILPMLEAHSAAAIGSAYVNSENVSIFQFDTIAPQYIKDAQNPFLKIDTQGYEWQVIDGAHNVLPKICGVVCELSLVPLYKGQKLWLDIIERLESAGFTLWALQNGFIDPRDGRSLQMDAIFFRLN